MQSEKKTFTIFTVHLTNSDASERHGELQEIQDKIAKMTKKDVGHRSVIIAGDFNTGAGSLKPLKDVFEDTEKTMEIL